MDAMNRPGVLRLARNLVPAALVLSLAAPFRHYEHNPTLAGLPKTAFSRKGVPADPLTVGLIGTRDEVERSLKAAGWYPADPHTIGSDLEIAASAALGFRYADAPVSGMVLWGRKQDLAYEQPVRGGARRRHHVRFWQSLKGGPDGRPLWIGAATYDCSLGFVRHTLKITHRIAPDVDTERDKLIEDLASAGRLETIYQVTGTGQKLYGRTANGDWYFTDGELTVGILAPGPGSRIIAPRKLTSPVAVKVKNGFWKILRPLLRPLERSRRVIPGAGEAGARRASLATGPSGVS